MKPEDTCRVLSPHAHLPRRFRLFATTACAIIFRAQLEKAIHSHQKGGAYGQGARLDLDGPIHFDVTSEDSEQSAKEKTKGVDLP